ncbi:hypothetical protein [Mesorhizobium sp. B2-1-3A]|uniref:hypothetical protein n=1 Tax=Mesorhizobium sp. B2-1-3A TaxID=2589971 RepID=UPI0011298A57|nr:hypothetical protein [Mesorhizobium sp. B2-1-3A]TPM99177.1 hypothetical protein FJ977_07090 [Mesorhizobium sp. B2-1-3A]
MSNDPFQKARDKIAFYESAIHRLEEWIATGEALLADGTESAPAVSPEQSGGEPKTGSIRTINGRSVFVPSSPTAMVIAEAQSVLREAGKPMVAADIFDKLMRRGVKIAGNSPKGNMTAKFSTRRDIFTFEGKETGLWSLTEWGRKAPQTNEALPEQSESASKVAGEVDASPIETQARDGVFE